MKKLALLILALLALSVAKQSDGFSGKIDVNAISALDSGASAPVIIVFKNNTGKAVQSSSISAMASSFSATRSYSLLNMAAGRASAQALDALQNNPNVEKVYYDYEVKLIEPIGPPSGVQPMLQDSVPLIGASNITVNNVSINGTGIKIAIVDTGVNYSHSDLGNCTSAQFLNGTCSKVPEGYDFANNDNNPLDEQGHGTHVAGIAAANGNIRGVAPGAQIIAVKVFPASGGASTSDIIAGMEFSVLRGANIVSLSLGGMKVPHNGRDIMALAADALSNRALFVIAAGNSYSLGSIGSPGLSSQAITVGATDKSDAMASFSSRGGTSDGRIDPDIVAPGVSINSTWYTGGYTPLQGTSMATPHVTGVAALVMQANPTWSVARVKQAIVNTAKDLGLAWKNQGSGRLNASEAVTNKIWVSPNYLQTEQYPGTTRTLLLNITNEYASNISVNLTASNITKLQWQPSEKSVHTPPTINSGNVSFNATSFNVTANATVTVQVNVTVPAGSEAGQWEGFVYVSTNRSIAIPLALTVPANTTFAGSVYNYCTEGNCVNPFLPGYDTNRGDWQFYKFNVSNTAYRSIDVNVSWNYTGSDIDFYIIDPRGNTFSAVADSTTFTFENRTITDIVPGEYLVEVHAYSINSSTRPLNITGAITYTAYAPFSSNDTVDFGYVYPNATKTVSINLTNSAPHAVTVAVTNTALDEQWNTNTIASSALSYNTSFSLAGNASVALNMTLNASSAASGTYFGNMTYGNGSANLTLPVKVVVLLPNSTLNITFSESVSGRLTDCDTRPFRELHLNTSLPNLAGFSTVLNWSGSATNVSAVLINPSGDAFNFTAGRLGNPANFSISPAGGVWRYQFCYAGTAAGSYSLAVQNLYNTYIQTYSDAGFSTLAAVFAPGQTVYYKAFVLDANNASVNTSANVTIFDPANASANTTTNVFLGGNYTANYTLASNATNGTWRIVAYPSSNAVQNETSFNVTQNATRLSLPVEAAYRLDGNITLVASVRDQIGNPIPNQNITLNITNSTNGTVFNATNQSNSSGYASFTFSINATGTYAANATSGNLSNSSAFLVQQLSQVLLNTTAPTYSPGSTVVFNVTLLSTTGAQMLTNETLNITLKDPSNATNQTSTVYITGNGSSNLTLDPFATNGNWTLNVSDGFFGVSNSTAFSVNTTYNASISLANRSVQPNATAVVYVNITNTGNTNNTFYVNFTRSASWSTNMTNTTLNFTPGQSANLSFNFSVPFENAGTLNTVNVSLTSLYGSLSMNATFVLNVSAVYNFTMAANVSAVTNFSLPDAVTVLVTLQSFSNANDTVRIQTSANASGWNATMNQNFTDQNFSLNQSQQRNVSLNVSVPGNAAGTIVITITATSLGSSAYNSSVNVTFTVPTVTVATDLSPLTATLAHYPGINVLNFTFSASDAVDGTLLPASLPYKTCSLANGSFNNIVVNASSSGSTLYCTFTGLGPSLAQGDYLITVAVNDSRNHTGSTTIHAGNHRSMTVLVTNPGTLAVGASFFIDGTAYYNSGNAGGVVGQLYWVYNGTVTAQIKSGTTVVNTVNGTVSGGSYHLSATAPLTAGSYTIITTVGGIWGISGTGGPTPAFSVITLGGGGGGGGGGGAALPAAGAVTVQPAITSTQATAGGNTTFSLQLTNTYNTPRSVNISASEGGTAVHFDLEYSNTTTIPGNSNATAQVTVKPFKYAKPGNYTLSIQADNSTKTVTISIPKPALTEGAINANRYVELSRAQNESYVYLEAVNRMNVSANFTVTDTIPKNVSNTTGRINFITPYSRIVEEDPVVEWALFLAPNESKELAYTVNHSIKNMEFPEPNITFAVAAAPGTVTPGANVTPGNVTPENVTAPLGPEATVVVGGSGGGIDISIILVIILVAGGAAAFAFKDAIREKLFKKPKPKVYEAVPLKRAPAVFEAPKEEKKRPPSVFEIPLGPEAKKEEKKPPAVYEEIKP